MRGNTVPARPIPPGGPNWDVIKTEYVCGSDSLRVLGEKYNIPLTTMMNRCHRGDWAEERRHMKGLAQKAAQADLVASMAEEIRQSDLLDLSNARRIKAAVSRMIDEYEQGQQKLTAADLSVLSNAAERAQRIAKLATGAATTISESNIEVRTQAVALKELSDEELDALEKAAEVMERAKTPQGA